MKSKESVVYLSKLKKCGVLIRQHTVLNPSDKSFIESWFGTFSQLFLKNVPGFLGDGIKSKRKDGKPNSDIIEKYRKKRELRTKRELDELLRAKIIEYNSTREYKNSTPNSLFANSVIKNGKKVDESLSRIILFKEKTCELTKAGIRLQVNNKLHEYLIYTDNIPFFHKYFNKEITIRYNPLNMDVIYLYPTDSFFHIATLNLHVNFPLAQVSQTEEDRNRIRDFSLKRYAMKKKLLNISKQSENKENNEEALPIELISEKYDSKELVTNSVKEYLLPGGKKKKKALKINYNQTVDESVPLINLSLGKMFNLPGSNKLIN
ncbi:Mu transposase C-terminal domain-containing protein [Mucilaginibacter sp. JRF]|uniref:Mu transposase C-terminal domain-containing protein n=1 Tax=Mucilaginibacter sp. JRF TaxID=2780088 RepID=UPI0018827EEA|nr:Mu transposase C-terminal domain-containing protein [Mucilaginibacter sp. JRF]MBE9583648.1 Mu transposase C-terminal domain-containing protein [Mucilaginibacter sp. JRF]